MVIQLHLIRVFISTMSCYIDVYSELLVKEHDFMKYLSAKHLLMKGISNNMDNIS